MENFEKIDIKNKITRNSYFYDNKIQYFKGQNYIKIKNECKQTGRLYEDPLFTPCNKNLYYSKQIPSNIKWMRPGQIVPKPDRPKFIEKSANANDLDQGYLGNCWFIAGCAAITFIPELFAKVVPKSQSFDQGDYCGLFHFRFWIYGIWYDVVIDDYLPVWDYSSGLVFCSNKEEPNEFWAALLEKAYAKVCGSYENLEGGFTSDALIDMSGGIEESFTLEKRTTQKNKDDLWKILCKSRQLKSMNAAYIEPEPYVMEEKLPNGLVKGHAYTISKIALIEYNNSEIRLIRLRNPWGRIEWKGAWSDDSREWANVSNEVKEALEFKIQNEGEFWMSFDDFIYSFDSIQFCHMTPDSFSDEILKEFHNDRISWKMISYHGEWVRNKSAGGSGNGGDKRYWLNPQFLIKLVDVDLNDSDNLSTIVIALMQKFTRERRTQRYGEPAEEFIQFRLYKVRSEQEAENSIRFGDKLCEAQLERVGNSGNYINKREVTKRFKMSPGYYLIVPSTFEANAEGEFTLRVFTEKLIEDKNTSILTSDERVQNSVGAFFDSADNLDNGFKNWITVLGSSGDGRPASTKLIRDFSKSQFTGNMLESQLSSMSLNSDNIAKDKFVPEDKKRPSQICSVM